MHACGPSASAGADAARARRKPRRCTRHAPAARSGDQRGRAGRRCARRPSAADGSAAVPRGQAGSQRRRRLRSDNACPRTLPSATSLAAGKQLWRCASRTTSAVAASAARTFGRRARPRGTWRSGRACPASWKWITHGGALVGMIHARSGWSAATSARCDRAARRAPGRRAVARARAHRDRPRTRHGASASANAARATGGNQANAASPRRCSRISAADQARSRLFIL